MQKTILGKGMVNDYWIVFELGVVSVWNVIEQQDTKAF